MDNTFLLEFDVLSSKLIENGVDRMLSNVLSEKVWPRLWTILYEAAVGDSFMPVKAGLSRASVWASSTMTGATYRGRECSAMVPRTSAWKKLK